MSKDPVQTNKPISHFSPGRIEKQLAETLSQASHDAAKLSLLSLVVVYNKNNNSKIETLLDSLFGKRPLRIIRVETGYTSETSVEVSSRCLAGPKRGEVCFEEIIIFNGLDNKGLDPGLWTPLILRDIPAAVFWFDKTTRMAEVMEQAEHFIDVCIVDSLESEQLGEEPPTFFSFLYSYFIEAKKTEHRVPLVDIGWKRLEPLRQSTAMLFDPVHLQPALYKIRSVLLSGFSASEILLYTGWLAARLEWQFQHKNGIDFSFLSADQQIITIKANSKKSKTHSVEIDCKGSGIFSIKCSENNMAQLSSPDGTLPHILCRHDNSDYIIHEIDTLHTDPLFYDVLENINSYWVIEK